MSMAAFNRHVSPSELVSYLAAFSTNSQASERTNRWQDRWSDLSLALLLLGANGEDDARGMVRIVID
jgi:hypothetical protein